MAIAQAGPIPERGSTMPYRHGQRISEESHFCVILGSFSKRWVPELLSIFKNWPVLPMKQRYLKLGQRHEAIQKQPQMVTVARDIEVCGITYCLGT